MISTTNTNPSDSLLESPVKSTLRASPNIWIPDLSAYRTSPHAREYLNCNHAARHEFLARYVRDWPELAKEPFFVLADQCLASILEFLGDEADYFGRDDEEEEAITNSRDDSEVLVTRGAEYDEKGVVSIYEALEDEDIDAGIEISADEESMGEVDESGYEADIEDHVMGLDDDEYLGQGVDGDADEEASGWAEVMEQIDALTKR